MTRRSALAIALAAVLLLAACGDDDDGASADGAATTMDDDDGTSGDGLAPTKTTTITVNPGTVNPGPGCKVTGLGLAAMAEGVKAGGRWQLVLDLVPQLAGPLCEFAFGILTDTLDPAPFEVTTATGTIPIPLSRNDLIPSATTPTDCGDWPIGPQRTLCNEGWIDPPAIDMSSTCEGWLPITSLVDLCKQGRIGVPGA